MPLIIFLNYISLFKTTFAPVICFFLLFRLIGTAVLYLDSLSFLLEIEETTPVIDFKGKQVGELTCELIALSIGSKNLIDNFEEFQLKKFIGKELKLEMRVIGTCVEKNVFFKFSISVILDNNLHLY